MTNTEVTAATAPTTSPKQLTPVPTKAWGMMLLVLFMSIAAPLNMFKAPGIAGTLMETFNLDPGSFGWLMSAFTFMGIVLAFPAAGIMTKLGVKTTTTISLLALIVGSLIGTFAPGFEVLLAGRVLEGISMGLVSVTAATAISKWFPQHKRGLAMGIWAPWVPLGNILMLNLANPIMDGAGSWTAVWWFGTIYAVVFLALWLLLYKDPEKPIVDPGEELIGNEPGDGGAAKSNNGIILFSMIMVAVSFLVFNAVQNGSINTFYPTYLMEVHEFSQPTAASVTSVVTILAVPGCIFGGWIADLIGTRKWVIIGGYAIIAIAFIWLFTWTEEWQMWLAIALCGLFAPLATTNIFASAPEIMGPAKAGMGMAIIAFFQNIGNFIGGFALGYVQADFGWSTGSYMLCFPLLALAIICVLLAKRRLK